MKPLQLCSVFCCASEASAQVLSPSGADNPCSMTHPLLPILAGGDYVLHSGCFQGGLVEALSVTPVLVGEIYPPPQPVGSSTTNGSIFHQLLPLLIEPLYTDDTRRN
jgi:hypothetical protein